MKAIFVRFIAPVASKGLKIGLDKGLKVAPDHGKASAFLPCLSWPELFAILEAKKRKKKKRLPKKVRSWKGVAVSDEFRQYIELKKVGRAKLRMI